MTLSWRRQSGKCWSYTVNAIDNAEVGQRRERQGLVRCREWLKPVLSGARSRAGGCERNYGWKGDVRTRVRTQSSAMEGHYLL